MSHWNYRIVRTLHDYKHSDDDAYTYNIHEVYYGKRGSITNWTAGPAEMNGFGRASYPRFLAKALIRATRKNLLEFNHAGRLIEVGDSKYTRRNGFAQWVKDEWVVDESGKVSVKGVWWWFMRAVRTRVGRW